MYKWEGFVPTAILQAQKHTAVPVVTVSICITLTQSEYLQSQGQVYEILLTVHFVCYDQHIRSTLCTRLICTPIKAGSFGDLKQELHIFLLFVLLFSQSECWSLQVGPKLLCDVT
jgi:hypothetical protein